MKWGCGWRRPARAVPTSRRACDCSSSSTPFVFACSNCGLELHDVLRRGALLALHDVELDPLALGQRLEALRLDRGVVHEAVLLAVLGCDKAKTLRVVEPLHDTGDACHLLLLLT